MDSTETTRKMDQLRTSASELAGILEEKGYVRFNFRNGRMGTDFQTGLLSCVPDDTAAGFRATAGTAIRATSPDEPYSIATFTIAATATGILQVASLRLALYENADGGLRESLTIAVRAMESIPTVEQANRLLEEAWQQRYLRNTGQWKQAAPKSKGRKRGI